MKKRLYLFLTLAILLSGCGTKYTYHKPGVTQQEFVRDDYECEKDMRRGYFGEGGPFTDMRMRAFYRRCMVARGYTIREE